MTIAASSSLPSASTLRSRAAGMFACAGFGSFWAMTALTNLPASLRGPGYAITGAASLALLAAGIGLLRDARHAPPPDAAGAAARRRTARDFLLIFVAEIVAMNIAAQLLAGSHMAYLMPVIAIIVGIHFYPLAGLLRSPHYRITAGVMSLAGVLGIAAIAAGGNLAACQALVDFSCAVALWVSGLVSWRRALQTRRA